MNGIRRGKGRSLALVAIALISVAVGTALAHKGSAHITSGTARLYGEGGFRTLVAAIVDGGPVGVDGGLLEVTRETCPPRSPDCVALYRITCAHTLVLLPAETHTHQIHAAAIKTAGSDAFPTRYFLKIIDKRVGVDLLGVTSVATGGPCSAEAPRSLVSLVNFSTWP